MNKKSLVINFQTGSLILKINFLKLTIILFREKPQKLEKTVFPLKTNLTMIPKH